MAIKQVLDLGFILTIGVVQNFEVVLRDYQSSNKFSLEDCIYLQTCREHGYNLITLDKKLKKEFEQTKNSWA